MPWGADVLAVYDWSNASNRGEDSKNDNDLNQINAPTFTQTGVKYNTAWTNAGNNANRFELTSTFKDALKVLTSFTFETWFKIPAIDTSSEKWNIVLGYNGITGCFLGFSTGAIYLNQFYFAVNGSGANYTYTYPATDTWVRVNLEWDGSTYKVYVDGVLLASRSSNTNFFNNYNATGMIGRSDYNNQPFYSLYGYFDRYIISDVARGGLATILTPTITDISPATGSTAGGTDVTITGTEFAAGATVTFDGDSATDIIVVSATEITCVTPAHTAGAVDVVITNTDTGTVTSASGFTYVALTGAKSVNSNNNIATMGSNVKKVISNNNIAGGF